MWKLNLSSSSKVNDTKSLSKLELVSETTKKVVILILGLSLVWPVPPANAKKLRKHVTEPVKKVATKIIPKPILEVVEVVTKPIVEVVEATVEVIEDPKKITKVPKKVWKTFEKAGEDTIKVWKEIGKGAEKVYKEWRRVVKKWSKEWDRFEEKNPDLAKFVKVAAAVWAVVAVWYYWLWYTITVELLLESWWTVIAITLFSSEDDKYNTSNSSPSKETKNSDWKKESEDTSDVTEENKDNLEKFLNDVESMNTLWTQEDKNAYKFLLATNFWLANEYAKLMETSKDSVAIKWYKQEYNNIITSISGMHMWLQTWKFKNMDDFSFLGDRELNHNMLAELALSDLWVYSKDGRSPAAIPLVLLWAAELSAALIEAWIITATIAVTLTTVDQIYDYIRNNVYQDTPSNSPIWWDLDKHIPWVKTKWKWKKRKYYWWDYLHWEIEVWDKNGYHEGSIDPKTWKKRKPRDKKKDKQKWKN